MQALHALERVTVKRFEPSRQYVQRCRCSRIATHCGRAHKFQLTPFSSKSRTYSAAATNSGLAEADAEDEDQMFMLQALQLARKGLGKTAPNPAVGCVIVKHGKVIGEGFHPKAGEPHAEVFALRAAGQGAEGATAYVTLEPCNHYGKTPPCSKALVAAKVARVVVGVGDPNPLVGGAGIATLEKAGIAVSKIGGNIEQLCYDLNPEFMKEMEAGS